MHSDITLTPSGTDVDLILALTTATYNNLQRHRWWYVWSPTRAHAPRPCSGSHNPPSVWGSGCTVSSKDLVSLQVFHQSAGLCTSGLRRRNLALLNAWLAAKSQPVIRLHACAGARWRGLCCKHIWASWPEVSSRGFTQTPWGSSSFLLPLLLLLAFCSLVFLIENVFIAGPEAGLGKGRRCSLWRCGWGEGRRVWLLFSTTNSPTQFFFSLSVFWLLSLFTAPSRTSLSVCSSFLAESCHSFLPSCLLYLLSLFTVLDWVCIMLFQMQIVPLGLIGVRCCQKQFVQRVVPSILSLLESSWSFFL